MYTALIFLMNLSILYGTNMIPDRMLALVLSDKKEVAKRMLGSMLVMALEQAQLFTLYGVKSSVWLFQVRRL